MISIAEAVKRIISESSFLEELMALDIVNFSGLAREMKSSVEERTQKNVTEASVMMALKRLNKKRIKSWSKPEVYISMPELTVRSNLFEITIKNSPTLLEKQKKLIAYANRQQSLFTTFTYGLFETTIIASNQLHDMAMSLYKKEEVISKIEDVSSITIKFPTNIVDSPFAYYAILRTLVWSGVSIVELFSTYSELVLVLRQKDIELVFSLVNKLFSSSKGK